MIWRFKLEDRNAAITVIDEPAGWDQTTITVARDPAQHGLFFSQQEDNLQFRDEAERILYAEYDQYGNQGIMYLILEENCGQGFEEFDRAKLDFNSYDRTCDNDDCFIKMVLEQVGDLVDLRDRDDQKVNLETTKAFDETTDLPVYAKLPFPVLLPSKGIFIQDHSINETNSTEHFIGIVEIPTGDFIAQSDFGMIGIGLNKEIASEIGGYYVSLTPTLTRASGSTGYLWGTSDPAIRYGASPYPNFLWPLYIAPILNYANGTLNYGDINNPCRVSFRLAGSLTTIQSKVGNLRSFFLRLPDGASGELLTDYEFIDVQDIHLAQISEANTISFDVSYDADLIINKKDRFYLFIGDYQYKTRAQVESGTDAFTIIFNTDSFFKLTDLSKTPATDAKVFMVNEALSRVTEVITNNRIKVYSEYFGRTDSEPYSLPTDGCGSLEAITNGLRIRRQETTAADNVRVFSVSLKDLREGLNAIHNIGTGVEADPARPGYYRMRVEPWKFFYTNELLMSCTGVNKIQRKAYEKEVFSILQVGYAKWEAEQYNGLDEFLTKRNFRTTLQGVKNTLTKFCSFIASPYAWEITRRISNTDTKDWRYDNDTFIVCLRRGRGSFTSSAVFLTSGNNIFIPGMGTNPYNLFTGDTLTVSGTTSNNGVFTVVTVVVGSYLGTPGLFIIVAEPIIDETVSANFNVDPGTLNVEVGNITSPANIIDPASMYNFRITPLRNAMRWLNTVIAGYRQFTPDAKIIFTDGEGNYFAAGELADALCRLENDVITENQTLSSDNFEDADDAKPLLITERVIYEYPMSSRDFKHIKAHPTGKIFFQNDCDEGYGYIDTIVYKPNDGLAIFTLIPTTDQTVADGLLTEDGRPIVTEDQIELIRE